MNQHTALSVVSSALDIIHSIRPICSAAENPADGKECQCRPCKLNRMIDQDLQKAIRGNVK